MNMNYNIPWSTARNTVHLGYDYVLDEPGQFDVISEIPDDELEELKVYATLQRHYDKEYTESPSDWSDIIKLISVEQSHRKGEY